MAAREHHLGLPIEGAKQFALPIVPDPGAHGADVANGEDKKHFEAFKRLHAAGEGRNGCACRQDRAAAPYPT